MAKAPTLKEVCPAVTRKCQEAVDLCHKMAKAPPTIEDVYPAVTQKCLEATKLCEQATKELKKIQQAYEKLIKNKGGKMDPPTIEIENCLKSANGVVKSKWTFLETKYGTKGKFYKG